MEQLRNAVASLVYEDYLLGAVTLGAMLVLAVVWKALLLPESFSGRLKALDVRRKRLHGEASSRRRHGGERSFLAVSALRRFLVRFGRGKGDRYDEARQRLQRAGLRDKDALALYMAARMCLPIVFGGTMVLLVYVLQVMPTPPFLDSSLCGGGLLLGWYGPDMYVKNVAKKRILALSKVLPDALDLLTVCVEAGLSLDMGLSRVSREISGMSTDLAYELHLTSIELAYLSDRGQAFDNLATRNETVGVRALVNAFGQTEKFGTPLAQTLRVLSAEFRNERMMKAEEKGARLPAMMTLPLMVFIMPTLFLIIMGPGIIGMMNNF